MKKFIFLIFSVLYLQAISQNNLIDKPVIKFDTTTYTFGKVKKGEEVAKKFFFTNEGTEPLIVINVQTTCGCTVTDWTKKPLGKGEKGYVTVKYKSDKKGKFSKTAYVFSNAKNSPVELKIRGEVIDN